MEKIINTISSELQVKPTQVEKNTFRGKTT